MKKNIFFLVVLAMFYILFLQNCGSSGGSSSSTPAASTPVTPITGATISGLPASIDAKIGEAITTTFQINNVSPVGATYSISIAPALPAGLKLVAKNNATSGTISGTPTVVYAKQTHTLTLTGTGSFSGTVTSDLSIEVVKNPITGATFMNLPASIDAKIGEAITTTFQINNVSPVGATYSISIAPALPAGLQLVADNNATSGTISGTPTVAHAKQTHTLTLTGTGSFSGTVTSDFSIEVLKIPITGATFMNLPASIDAKTGEAITPVTFQINNVSPVGATYSISIAPALPAGLKLVAGNNAVSGTISGTPTVGHAKQTHTLTLTGTGSFSGTVTSDLSIEVLKIFGTIATADHAASLSSANEIDWYKFTAATNDSSYFIFAASDVMTVTGIYSTQQSTCEATSTHDTNSKNIVAVQDTTQGLSHYVCVKSLNNATGDYTLKIRSVNSTVSTDNASFIYFANDVVLEKDTSLLWQRTDGGETNWTAAVSYCNTLTLAGYDNWYLPTKDELTTIGKKDTNLKSSFTNNTLQYWSSTIDVDNPSLLSWAVYFKINIVFQSSTVLKENDHSVRCVFRP